MSIQILQTKFPEVKLFTAAVHPDSRGYFQRAFSASEYAVFGITEQFVEDNISYSSKNVLRGLHYDMRLAKFVQVLHGAVFDVVVDVRAGSPTFGNWEAFELSAENHKQLFVPKGFAHGFLTITGDVLFSYKQSAAYDPAHEGQLLWNDPLVGIPWPLCEEPILSEKDRNAKTLAHLGGLINRP